MRKLKVSIGNKYNRLTVLDLIPDRKNPKAKCLCECGNIIYPQRGALLNGRTKSCGCKRKEDFIKQAKTHGMSKTRTYMIWKGINGRCSNINLPEYKNYGGRGIKVIWKTFEDFFRDMGYAPKGYWIDRINNDGNYEKNNCRWLTPQENQENKRASKLWVINGIAYASSRKAALALGVDPSLINRGCNGYIKYGKHHPPREGWGCYLKY